MPWADRIIGEIENRFRAEIENGDQLVIRDEKTLSGRVHVGSLRGIVIHGLIAQILKERGIDCEFKFELNGFDPMDGLPAALDPARYEEHMGKPLFAIPSPDHKELEAMGIDAARGENYPSVFGSEIREVTKRMKLPIEFYNLRPLYVEGKFNDCIRKALDRAAEIRAIYREVSGGVKPDDWYPMQVICENCGRIGTTKVIGWNGVKVQYRCEPNMVSWAKGCGRRGEASPFGGNGKLPWKVEWAAKWKVLGVHIEGCGKDHSTAGGSRAIASRVSEEIFEYPDPFNIPYEFFNFRGRKMSASKGIGASAKEISDMLPPTLLKLLMIRLTPNRPIDFDPNGKTIPNLFDEYDRLSDHYFGRHAEPDEDLSRTFRLTQLRPEKSPADIWHMRFTILSFVLQMPHLNLMEEAEKLKGAELSSEEKNALGARAVYVRQWLKQRAPDDFKYVIRSEPPTGLSLDSEQKDALKRLSAALPDIEWEGNVIHETIHKVKDETGIAPKKLFQPLYQIFLGRKSGPQMGWFLSTIDKTKALEMIEKTLR